MRRWCVTALAAGAAVFVLILVAPSTADHFGIVATSGYELPDPEDTPATLYDLETVTGTVNPYELVGQPVDFHLRVTDTATDDSFWVGAGDNRVLAVATTGGKPPAKGQFVRIVGTIERLRPAGRDQKIYIQAKAVTPEP